MTPVFPFLVQRDYNNEFTNIPDYQTLCTKISLFPAKILDTFGEVNTIANLPKISNELLA